MKLGRIGRRKSRLSGASLRPASAPGPGTLAARWRTPVLVASYVVLVAAMTREPSTGIGLSEQDLESRSIAPDTVRSLFTFQTENLEATEEKRTQAAAGEPETYRVDRQRVRKQLDQLDQLVQTLAMQKDAIYEAIRQALQSSTADDTSDDVVEEAITNFAAQLAKQPAMQGMPEPAFLALWLTPDPACIPQRVFETIADSGERTQAPRPANRTESARVVSLTEPQVAPLRFAYADQLAALAKDGLEYVLTHGVITAGVPRSDATRKVVILREDPLADQAITDELALQEVPDPEQSVEMLRNRIVDKAKQLASSSLDATDWANLQGAAFAVAKLYLTDTLFFDRVYTESARERARANVQPVMKEIQPGEVLQRAGERWTKQSRSDVLTYLRELQAEHNQSTRVLYSVLAHMMLVFLVLACLSKSVPLLMTSRISDRAAPDPDDEFRHLCLALLLMTSTVVVGRVAYYFEPSGFILPTTAVAILLAILAHARLATMTSFLTNGLLSALYGYDWRLLILGCAMSVTGVFSIFVVRRRSDMARAALNATVIGIIAALAITLATDSVLGAASFHRLIFVAMNGALCLLIVPALQAPLERIFQVTTDIQLLEYSDLNNEILGRMAVEMPATFAHSLMLGQLAEAAADAIGANGLLARVCAYYHDIGKLRRPEYFSENQTGVNVHDGLSPRLSARAIESHVTQGVEIAREFHLPAPIIDAIREHHGTSLISFFYKQALDQHKHGDVQEEDFRYPGPKPQSREVAILMICDAVESGVRSIKNPNVERVMEFVDKIITSRAEDGQFDECDLTLKDLTIIGEVVSKTILSNLHRRIAYPDTERTEKAMDNVIPLSGGGPE